MASLFPREQLNAFPVFDHFNQGYGDAIIHICHFFSKFQIDILLVSDYISRLQSGDVPEIQDIEIQTFSNYIIKDGESADSTRAAIIFNPELISAIGLTEHEQYAAIAHEIGHLLFFFLDNKEQIGPQEEEIYADGIASRIGLNAELLSTLEKLENSGIYPNGDRRFGMRKLMLRPLP